MGYKVKSLLMLLPLVIAGCASTPESILHPVTYEPLPEEICLIDNPAVNRSGFLPTYKQALENKGFKVTVLEAGSEVGECEWTATYVAHWRWDLAAYMERAQLYIYKDDWVEGEVSYHGGYGLDKFIDAEEKIYELVDMLFPSRLGNVNDDASSR